MKLHILALLCATQLSVVSASHHGKVLHRRQSPPVAAALPSTRSSSSSSSAATTTAGTSSTSSTTNGTPGTPAAASTSVAGATTVTLTSVAFTPPPAATGATASNAPPLASITSGMPTGPTPSVSTTYKKGATGPVPGAPGLPTPFVFQMNKWPAQDRVPDTSSPEVQEWMKELDGFFIPNLTPTVDGSCAGDPAAAAQASQRGWWTCGGYTRSTDITACPDKFTWGVSFDDGPGPYTQNVLDYLKAKDISATFFVVGSRVIERPLVLIEEYMAGHEISVHTWSHRPLTSLTNAQIVAELGWTRKAIHEVLGVTPTTMRPPFGDIDDRVRAISLAMGLVPIMWTRTKSGGTFDTNDWRVAAGQVTGVQSFQTFQTILANATDLDTGFIVLQHDIHEATVDLAVGYTLDAALHHNPPFNLMAIGECTKTPATNLYLETTQNSTFPYSNRSSVDVDGDGDAETVKGRSSDAVFTQSSIFTVLLAAAIASSSLLF